MTTQVLEDAAPDVRPTLDYGRTIERSLAHRSAISEVFVTDVRTVRPMAVTSGIHLPLTHLYYSDHRPRPKLHDSLLLLEAGRQASIAGGHTNAGVPAGTVAIVHAFQFSLRNLSALRVGGEPGQPRIDTDFFGKTARHSGRFRKGRLEQRIFMGDVHVGDHAMDVLFLKGDENEILRHAQRGTPAPLSSEFTEWPGVVGRVAPELVGRDNPLNVVLTEPEFTAESVTAQVVPRFDNPALFDHSYDHLPAMALVEAARQLALVTAGAAPGPASASGSANLFAAGYEGGFQRFAELDVPLTATAARTPASDGRHTVRVRFRQDDQEIAELSVTVVDVSHLHGS
ncbi:A-factor biosynthesis hotdog protein [Streptomyces sp. 840.1]|uniref:AfsA-related hotdog domain-containing protein n=1 Tax=Streptomyces sp. 840.1 TaxID=2485152 RepID=UPI000F481D95|nr:AfsA-related hotdog domain-containing protein [Streptomyces sp. 840.1]ROQ68176.1 A-factor biosynthesis hotdog protein [Streptomyces sp. 840.1]